jgi:serine-type D-Ala-D-Ala carboxypeptidase/endopeptidase (penicillin-binding protein 4)
MRRCDSRLAALVPWLFGLCGLILSVTQAPAQEPQAPPTPAPATLAELRQRLAGHFDQPRFAAALWGVKIVSLESGVTVFEQNPAKLFSPASNCKLYTVALALDRLGPDYRIKTSLYARARPKASGVLDGDLILYGRGDPTINSRLTGGDLAQVLEPLVAALTNAGVKRINGDVIGDDSYFRGAPFGSGWTWDDLDDFYGAEVSALTINDNRLLATITPAARVGAPCRVSLSPANDWITLSNRATTTQPGTVPSVRLYHPLGENLVYVSGQLPLGAAAYNEEVTVHNPAGLFAAWFKAALARHGIKVKGRARSVNWLEREAQPLDFARLVELGAVASLPLREIVREVQKPSQNLYADLLLAHVGETTRGPDTPAGSTSEELGVLALNRFLAKVGIPPGQTLFDEGSGLSRNNLTTPNATVLLLQFMSRHPCAREYWDALPIAGVDGTLRARMKGTPAEGKVRAKTGTLRWANALSGQLTTAAGEHMVFSLMVNRLQEDTQVAAELDTIVAMLASFTGHTTQ